MVTEDAGRFLGQVWTTLFDSPVDKMACHLILKENIPKYIKREFLKQTATCNLACVVGTCHEVT
jgi:hypothetical protein